MSVIFGTADLYSTEPLMYALECGYRHIDTAQMYENEDLVGSVISATKIPRAEITVISKVSQEVVARGTVRKTVLKHLKELDLRCLDVALIHYPGKPADTKKAWRALENLVRAKKIHRLGVSNFNLSQLQELLNYAKIQPQVLQIPYEDTNNNDLLAFCQRNGIHVQAYGVIKAGGNISHLLERDIDTVISSNTNTHIKANLEHQKKRGRENERPQSSRKKRRVKTPESTKL